MKNINYVINGVLAVAVIILFIMQFSDKKESRTTGTSVMANQQIEGVLPIAYVNMDSLLMSYNYYLDLNERLMKKEENYRAVINGKVADLRTQVADFERKYRNNAFLTAERAQQEQQRLAKLEQQLEELQGQYSQELMLEQQKLFGQLGDTLISQVNRYNKTKGYQVIFSNNASNGTILVADDMYDITQEIVDHLNKNYLPSSLDK